jgi:hypothetical protein
MSIKTIESELNAAGYYCHNNSAYLMVLSENGEVPNAPVPSINTDFILCSVRTIETGYEVIYRFTTLPGIEEFTSESKAIAYIKEKFPL